MAVQLFHPLPGLGLLAYARAFGAPLPSSPRSLASHRSRLDIAARLVMAFLYTGLGVRGPRCDRFVAVSVEEVAGLGAVTSVFTCECLPPDITHPAAYEVLLGSLLGSGPCPSARVGFEEALQAIRAGGLEPVLLSEDGVPFRMFRPPPRALYVIGTAVDPPPVTPAARVSVGPYSYHADHVAAFLSYVHDLERAGELGYGSLDTLIA